MNRDELERLLVGEHAQAERARGTSGGCRPLATSAGQVVPCSVVVDHTT